MGKSLPMDISSDLESDNLSVEHPRSIVHLDIDCFYAQVELLRHPQYRGKPLGVQQKNLVVTCNYEARAFGIKKCMSVEDALCLCPNLILVRGEDLTPYKRISTKVTELLHQFTPLVEKLGLDENFIDVTTIVNDYTKGTGENSKNTQLDENGTREEDMIQDAKEFKAIGEIFKFPEEECPCGCHTRLTVASSIAMDMRNKLMNELGITCSAGIAHNKLLAKLGGALHKPNQQTIVYPCSATELLSSLGSFSKIPGVGRRTAESLTANNILTVDDIRKTPLERLQVKIGKELARKMKDYAEGIDDTPIKPSGKPQSIGLEDGFKKVSLVDEVESRLSALLRRLTELAAEDGRIPVCVKLTVRKQDSFNKPSSSTGKRESRQCSIPQHLVPSSKGAKGVHLYNHPKILALIMKLFHRVVDVSKPFHLTLLGLAFTKFQEDKCSGKNSIASFLRKQVAVQSVMDISSEEGLSDASLGSPMSINMQDRSDCETDNDEEFRENKDFGNKQSQTNSCHRFRNLDTPSPIDVRCSGEDDEDILSEVEPSPKKTKLDIWLSGRRESPSNEMADLRLNTPSSSPISKSLLQNGPTAFKSTIPIDLDKPVNHSWPANTSGKKPNDLFKYFIANK